VRFSCVFTISSVNNSGYIYTVPSTQGVYEQQIFSNLELNTSGLSNYNDEIYEPNVVKDITKRALLGGNLGLGLDAGFTYYPKKHTDYSI
jgi:hypothetical protein